MYLRLTHPQTGIEVLVNVAMLPVIAIDYVDAAGNLLDPRLGRQDPAALRVFSFKIEGHVFRVRANDPSPAVAYLRQLYDEAFG